MGTGVEGVSYVFLEDLRRDIGRWELLRTLLFVRFARGRPPPSPPGFARSARRGPVHQRLGESPQGGALDARQPPQQAAQRALRFWN